MSRHDYAVLTLRGFALYAWFNALEYIGAMPIYLYAKSSLEKGGAGILTLLFPLFIPLFIYAAAGLFLFMRSNQLASRLLPPPAEEDGAEPPHPLAAASVAFAVVGVAFFLHALPGVLTQCIAFAGELDAGRTAQLHTYGFRLVGDVAQMVAGYLLFLKARTFATVWWRKQQRQPAQ